MTAVDHTRTEARERVARVEELLDALDAVPDPVARARAGQAVEALVDLYGEVLARVMARVTASTDPELARSLADDDLVCHLLLVHDVHPLGLEERIGQALDSIRSGLGDATATLVGVEAGVARIGLAGGAGCGSAAVDELLEAAVADFAPELTGVEIERGAAPVPVTLRPGRPTGPPASERELR